MYMECLGTGPYVVLCGCGCSGCSKQKAVLFEASLVKIVFKVVARPARLAQGSEAPSPHSNLASVGIKSSITSQPLYILHNFMLHNVESS